MKAAIILIAALPGIAFAAPKFHLADKREPFKDLTSLHYQQNLPVTEASANNDRREASRPVKDNRNLHYNSKKMPIAMASPGRQ
ncbi:hypothetical protein ISF_08549 [Cordyceps fumosorosea ARSEF 2679]|uniref:Uncharacterized protein n=1 Tax=Cordyceps fumosorosea (strain ARSEF 2679) TaxID=1081104 RepID=A0A167M2Z3_CORFA|nr:hypothetical protein ISF_08549 [Cordyceps fumosorosea ARSEF 2679]OAA53847.1 hypothetical protein ISF_08549 [Cordyceps fumosorosea ARSEF 2679]